MIPLRDSQNSGRLPFITTLLIIINCAVFYLESTTSDIDRFFAHYALIPALVDWTNPITLVPFFTAMFLHGGLFHLVSNMWFLWIFGDNVEDAFRGFYLPLYIIGGLAGGVLQYSFSPDSILPIVGASGAIASVLGAYFVLYPRNTIVTFVPIFFFITLVNIPAFVALGYWFFLQLFNGSASLATTAMNNGGVAYFAHIGGFITGVVAALVFPPPNRKSD
jgi:membrane associated rhomboid family serine protease